MSKICPKCRREQEDPSHLGCEKCKVPFVDATELVTSFTRDELKVISGFLLKDWRVYVVAGIFLLIGVGLLYWQAREHIKTQIEQFQVTVSNQVVTAYSTATNQLAKFKNFAEDASNQVVQAYSSVTNQIAEEFQTPRIKQTVESVAKGEAKSILEAEVQPWYSSAYHSGNVKSDLRLAHFTPESHWTSILQPGVGPTRTGEELPWVSRPTQRRSDVSAERRIQSAAFFRKPLRRIRSRTLNPPREDGGSLPTCRYGEKGLRFSHESR